MGRVKVHKTLEITGRFANDATIMKAGRVRSSRDETFSKVYSFSGSGENRRRDDDEATQEEEAEGDDEGNKDDFDREAIIDEATVEGESESDDQFYDAQVGEEEPMMKHQATRAIQAHLPLSSKIKNLQESTPRVPLAEKLTF
ncbi:hypothetical protein Dimus_026690 [Dionaea muscipula]